MITLGKFLKFIYIHYETITYVYITPNSKFNKVVNIFFSPFSIRVNITTVYNVDDSGKGRSKPIGSEILLGHGVNITDDFHKRDFKTTTELWYLKK